MGYADLEARLGAVALKRTANATITAPGGQPVAGVLGSDGIEAQVGMGVQARETQFSLPLASADGLVEGVTVVVTYRGEDHSRKVLQRLADDIHLQHAHLLLSRPL